MKLRDEENLKLRNKSKKRIGRKVQKKKRKEKRNKRKKERSKNLLWRGQTLLRLI